MPKAKKFFWGGALFFLILASFPILANSFNLSRARAQVLDLEQQEGFQEGEVPENFGGENPVDIREMIIDIVKIVLTFLAIIFLVLIIYGGYQWMTAAGNEDKVSKAKDTIKNGVIGVIIILAAYSITHFVLEDVLNVMTDTYDFW